jgi:uncharacterized protein YlzI (FlbEa/FlbD family)
MIQLTRLRHNDPFFLNPDLIERVDTHVDTVVRLTSGTEYMVNESGEEIVRRTAEFRARVIALAGIIQQSMSKDVVDVDITAHHEATAAAAELPPPPADPAGAAEAAAPAADPADDLQSVRP